MVSSRASRLTAVALVLMMVACSFAVVGGLNVAVETGSGVSAPAGSPSRATQFVIGMLPNGVEFGTPLGMSVTCVDASGNVYAKYRGTVAFTSTDPMAVLPNRYTYIRADSGSHVFPNGSLVFNTPGVQRLFVTDVDNSALQGNVTIHVTDTRVTLLSEHFDSWGSLDPHWTFWNCTNPIYNFIDMRNGSMYLFNIESYPVSDSYNAMANWTYPMTYFGSNLTIAFSIWLPYDDGYKYGAWGQFITVTLYDSDNVPRLIARFLMDSWSGAPSGFTFMNENNTCTKICDFKAGWHNCTISMHSGSPVWTASFDGRLYRNLSFTGASWDASTISKIQISNALREEPVYSLIDDLSVARVGPPVPPPNIPPVAVLRVRPTIGNAMTRFAMDATGSYDKEDSLASLLARWDFESDGIWDTGWSSSMDAFHYYSTSGEYVIALEIMDTGGLTSTAMANITVDAGAPYADAGADIVIGLNTTVNFWGNDSFDPETSIASYDWAFYGDGWTDYRSGVLVQETFTTPSICPVSVVLTVTDLAGNQASDTSLVYVWPEYTKVVKMPGGPLKSTVRYSIPGRENGDWVIQIENYGLRSVDLQAFETCANGTSPILEQTVRFSDYGAYPSGYVALSPIPLSRGSVYMVVASPAGSSGRYALFIDGFSNHNLPPVASFTISVSGMTVNVDASGSYDPDASTSDLKHVWSWGDGRMGYGVFASHTYTEYGFYEVTLRVIDNAGGFDEASLPVAVPGQPTQPAKFTVIYDMFQQPWGDWWSYRWKGYMDSIILSNQSGHYTMIYTPDRGRQAIIYAPYRMNVSAFDLTNLNAGHPEFMPVLGNLTTTGCSAEINLYFNYLDQTWWDSYWLPRWGSNPNWPTTDVMNLQRADGYLLGVVYQVNLNREAASAWLGMPLGADPVAWWVNYSESYRNAWISWLLYEGNHRLDIWSGYEFPLVDVDTMMDLQVNSDGTVTLNIGHFSFGFEVLMTRWLTESSVCNHEPMYEDFVLDAHYSDTVSQWVAFDACCQFSLHAVKANQTVDGSAWVWQPNAIDYVPSWSTPGGMHSSKYDLYANLTYTSWNAGDPMFGYEVPYENTPTWLDLGADSKLVFVLPKNDDVIGYVGTSVPPNAIPDIIRYNDYSAYTNITVFGSMGLGFYVTSANSSGGADLSAMYDTYNKTLTIDGPQYFDNVRHSNGALYHGAPWIEFDVTPGPVGNIPPIALVTVESASGLWVNVDGLGSYDPDGSIVSYSWTWGDGTSTTPPSSYPYAGHLYATNGTYMIRLQVVDNLGGTGVGYAYVTVSTTPPSLSNWSAPASIGAGSSLQQHGAVAIDSNTMGHYIVAWSGTLGGADLWGVFTRRYVPDVGWLGAEYAGPATSSTYTPCVGIDESGNITVAWIYGSSICCVRYTPSSALWEPLVNVTTSANNPSGLTMAVESHGIAVMSWQASDGTHWGIYASTRRTGNVWSAPTLIESRRGDAGNPSSAITDGGDAIVAFSVSNGSQWDIWANRYLALQSVWQGETELEGMQWYSTMPKASMDLYGNAFIVWDYCDGYVYMPYANVFRNGLGWGGPVLIDPVTSLMPTYPQVSAYGNCSAAASWTMTTSNFTYICADRYLNRWLGPVRIDWSPQNSFLTSISADLSGNSYLAWCRGYSTGNSSSGFYIEASVYTFPLGWSQPSIIGWVWNTSGPVIAAGSTGTAIMVWNEFGVSNDVWASEYMTRP